MIFTARQLFEKSRERDDPLFALFVDLMIQYLERPCGRLCIIMEYLQ